MLGSFREFLLRERSGADSDGSRQNKFMDVLEKFDESKLLNPPLSRKDVIDCRTFIYQGIDVEKVDKIISYIELQKGIDAENIGAFCYTFRKDPAKFLDTLKRFFYFLVIYQNLGERHADILTKKDRYIIRDFNKMNFDALPEIFSKKIYVYEGDEVKRFHNGGNKRGPKEDLEEENLYEDDEDEEGGEEARSNVGQFVKFTEVGQSLSDLIHNLVTVVSHKLHESVLSMFVSYSDIEKFFNEQGATIEAVTKVKNNPPEVSRFKNNDDEDIFSTESDLQDKIDDDEERRKELNDSKKKKGKNDDLGGRIDDDGRKIFRNGEKDDFIDGDEVSINGLDKDGNVSGISGFDVKIPTATDFKKKEFPELWNGYVTTIKNDLYARADNAALQYLKVQYSRQNESNIKESRFADSPFARYFDKRIILEETDIIKAMGLTKDMIKNDMARREAVKKFVDSQFSETNEEFKKTKEDSEKAAKAFAKGKRFNPSTLTKAQVGFRNIAHMAAKMLKDLKGNLDKSLGQLPNNIDDVYKGYVEDLENPENSDSARIAGYLFTEILDTYKNKSDTLAKIISGSIPMKKVMEKLNLGKEGIVYSVTPKNNLTMLPGRSIYYGDTTSNKDLFELLNSSGIKNVAELRSPTATDKFCQLLRTDNAFSSITSGALQKASNAYVNAYNEISKIITQDDGSGNATINLNGYNFLDRSDVKNIALRQRMAKFTLIQKDPANKDVFIIVRKEDAHRKIKEISQQNTEQKPEQNTQDDAQQQNNAEQNNTQNNAQNNVNSQQGESSNPAQSADANAPKATVTTASADTTYPPKNAFTKRMKEIIYKKGPYTVKIKE